MLRLSSTSLYDQSTFYDKFYKDIRKAKAQVIIESPFMTQRRVFELLPTLIKLQYKGVRVIVNTKPIEEHDDMMASQSKQAVVALQDIGVKVLFTNGHHRKIAIIDDILYEGSLNILSQHDSCELMRRTDDAHSVREMLRFIKLEKWCK